MLKSLFAATFLSTFAFANLPECHPDYQEWLSLGAPESWAYPRQCRGDTDGIAEGSALQGYKYVYSEDLALLMHLWATKPIRLTTDELAADFDHRRSSSPYTGSRIGTNDYCIFLEYYGVMEPPRGDGVPECGFTCPIQTKAIDGPILSLYSREEGQFVKRQIVNVFPGTELEVGIVNDSSDKCTCYDAYISVTGGNGTWTGANWVYNSSIFEWTYFGKRVAGLDTWYVATINPTAASDPTRGTVSAAVSVRYDGPDPITVTLFNEFFEEVDSLTITEPITLTCPNGGDVFIAGHPQTISWTANSGISNVDIAYSLDGGNSWDQVVTATANTGHFLWNIPAENSNQCLLRVTDSANPATFDVSDAVLTVFTCSIAMNPADFNGDCYVNLLDLVVFTESWLACGNPFDSMCGL